MLENIAFIGLGHMGHPMCENLLKANKKVTVFDLNPNACASLKLKGARVATSAADAVKEASIVITMLPSSPHVEDLYLGKGKILASPPKGTFFIDCSTIAPETARKVALAAQTSHMEMIDAPVSGGTAGAAAGTLTFIVGGELSSFEKAKPVLELMGKNIFHAGPSGTGQVAKICNNMLLAIHMIGTAEALNLGVASGMDPKVLSAIMSKSSGRNWSLEVYNPYPGTMDNVPSSRQYEGGFGVDLMAKDLGLAMEAALEAKTATPLGSLASSLYRMHSLKGFGTLDFSSILKLLQSS